MEIESNNSEIWQVEYGSDVVDVPFDELSRRIAEGSLLKIDRVRKGNLRWIEAGKVPVLNDFFNAKDLSDAASPLVTTSSGTNVEVLGHRSAPTLVTPASVAARPAFTQPSTRSETCSMHPEVPAAFVCDTCFNSFCKTCPNSYGGTVKICPFCGAMCKSIATVAKEKEKAQIWERATAEKFGASDFFDALAYPFKYKTSLFFGALLFAFFSLGQGAASFGGMFLMSAAIMCFMSANMLSFGVLANIVDNFSQGKIGGNFMPSFDEFSLWDDVIHPFFLSVGVYISSFGPLAITFIVAIFFIANSVTSGFDGSKTDAARALNPDLPYAANATEQSKRVKDLLANAKKRQADRMTAIENEIADAEEEGPLPANTRPGASGSQVALALPDHAAEEEKEFADLQNMMQDQRKAQLESAIGKTPETAAQEQQAMIRSILGYGAMFLLVAGLCLVWGMFYFPAACCVAGYTRSFMATLNPTVGLDTIRRLGVDYMKVLLMCLAILIASGMVSFVLAVAFSVFALPGVGNLPAKFVGSLFSFYFSVVFACVLGFAIYKASDRLQLCRG